MIFAYDLTGAEPIIRDVPYYGNGAAILNGAAVMRGATPGTNQGFAIVATGALASLIGVTNELKALVAAGADSKQDGTAYTPMKVIINPWAVYRAQYATGAIAVASSSTTTVTITSLEDDIDGGWLFGSDGQLQYLTASASGSCTSKTATGWTSAITVQKVLPMWHLLGTLGATAVNLDHAAAVGSGLISNLDNYVQARGIPLQRLDPTKHSGLTLTSGKLFSDIHFRTLATLMLA
jgi:hypothetical protein